MQQGQIGDKRRNERRHGGGFTRPVTARKRRDQLVKVKSSGKKPFQLISVSERNLPRSIIILPLRYLADSLRFHR
ncbi:MAG: hypothetical protein ACLRXB_05835 [Escherichia coli]